MELDMKRDWNERARENAEYYIASARPDAGDAFVASGARDVELFFQGVEHLLHPAADVLDIGCGIGRMDQHVAPRVRHLTGIDVSGEMVRKARTRLKGLGIDNATFVEGDGFRLGPIDAASKDVVFSHIVFQHMPRRAAATYFEDTLRVLRPGGTFLFQMPEASAETPADPPEEETFEMRFYVEDELRATLTGLGFDFVDTIRHPIESEGVRFNQMRLQLRKPS